MRERSLSRFVTPEGGARRSQRSRVPRGFPFEAEGAAGGELRCAQEEIAFESGMAGSRSTFVRLGSTTAQRCQDGSSSVVGRHAGRSQAKGSSG
ncbi:MAG: hypothetical protein BGO98_02245 [Myxococcales bacterium 68-20]|nr:MAG: hypothetical protein BGO98_02245 [Myxococcales bacterium 68-20]